MNYQNIMIFMQCLKRKQTKIETNYFTLEKKLNLHLKFKEIKKILETKYRISIDFMMEYDILMVGGLNKDIKVISGDLLKDIINYTKDILDEEYKLSPIEPLYISDNPNNIYSPDSRVYYNFHRLLKDNEPE